MLNTTTFLIQEGKNLTSRQIPIGYDYAGEDVLCVRCEEETVYGYWEHNDEGHISGEFMCATCGNRWSIL